MSDSKASSIRAWRRAVAAHKAAGETRSEAFDAAVKAGDEVVHDKGGHRQRCDVIRASSCAWSSDRIVVRNQATGKEYWIDAYHIVSVNGVEVPRE